MPITRYLLLTNSITDYLTHHRHQASSPQESTIFRKKLKEKPVGVL